MNSEQFILKSLQCSTNWTYKESRCNSKHQEAHSCSERRYNIHTGKNAANITVFKVTVDTSDVTYLQEGMF